MNAIRRKKISEVIEKLEELKEEIECLIEEEAEYRDNMPENLTGSERYEIADNACITMELAQDSLDDVVDYLNDVIS